MSAFARIAVHWLAPLALSIDMDEPKLHWTVDLAEPRLFHLMNRIIPRIPERYTRIPRSLRIKEWLARVFLGMGNVSLLAVTPNGQSSRLLTRRLFAIRESKAFFAGQDLGQPVRAEQNPAIGGFNLPARPVFAEGRAYYEILDIADYQKLRRELSQDAV